MKITSIKRHGTIVTYNKGCRCPECVEMHIVYGTASNISFYEQLAEQGNDWTRRSRCANDPNVDPQFFFQKDEDAAIVYCQGGCEVMSECLAHALAHPNKSQGVWGGVSEKNRDRVRRVVQKQRREFYPAEAVS